MPFKFDALLAESARWSYFVVALLSVMNACIHLHIQFGFYTCSDTSEYQCLGGNLAWRDHDNFDVDTNKLFWRQIFSFKPEVFLDVWTPLLLSLLALLQHFKPCQWNVISGSWRRAFFFILVWQLFGVLGYGSNFGVVVGLLGLCGVGSLYAAMTLLSRCGCLPSLGDDEGRHTPVLDLTQYLSVCPCPAINGFHDKQPQGDGRDSDVDPLTTTDQSSNDEQDHLAVNPIVMRHKQLGHDGVNRHRRIDTEEFCSRLSITQPGSTDMSAMAGAGAFNALKQRAMSTQSMQSVVVVYQEGQSQPSDKGRKKNEYAVIGQDDDEDDDDDESVVVHDEHKQQETGPACEDGADAEILYEEESIERGHETPFGDGDDDQDMVVIPNALPPPPPPPPPPAQQHFKHHEQVPSTLSAIEMGSDSDEQFEHDGLYDKPSHQRKVTES